MKKIKTKETESAIKVFNRLSDITNTAKNAYVKSKKNINEVTEEHNGGVNQYANNILEDIPTESSYSAEHLVKKKLKNSVQKRRSFRNQSIENTMGSGYNSLHSQQTNSANAPIANKSNHMFDKAKDRFIKNSIKAKTVGTTTMKEKVVSFFKGGYSVALNTAKIAITNTKVLVASLVGVGSLGMFFAIIICVIGLVMGSSFGIFMATEDTGTGYTLNTVIQEINEEYLAEIEKIKLEVPHDGFEMIEEEPNWKDILAVYAVVVTTAHEGAEVVTVDEEKAEIIRELFWGMTEIIYDTENYEDIEIVEITDEEGNVSKQEIPVTKVRLIISTNNKTAAEAAVEYSFNENQILQMDELLGNGNESLWNSLIQ